MLSVNKKKKMIFVQLTAGIIPFITSLLSAVNKSVIFLISTVIAMFLIVGAVPVFRHRANLWMFLMVSVAGIPINIIPIYYLLSEGYFGSDLLISKLLWAGLLYCIFFSVEEIVFGVITRLIWKRQYKINI